MTFIADYWKVWLIISLLSWGGFIFMMIRSSKSPDLFKGLGLMVGAVLVGLAAFVLLVIATIVMQFRS
jgi:hypothetical protein